MKCFRFQWGHTYFTMHGSQVLDTIRFRILNSTPSDWKRKIIEKDPVLE